MPAKLILELEPDKENMLRYHSAALLHGALMERVSPDFAEQMHISGLRPYSQSLRSIQGKTVWKINCLNEDAEKQILPVLLSDDADEIHLKHNDVTVKIISRTLSKTSYRDLIEKYYFNDGDRIIKLQIATPCSFKKEGKYVYYPDLHLIYQSLMKRFDAFSEKDSVYMEEALEDLTNYTEISGYNVRSTFFSLEGVRVPAFQGELVLKIHGPQQLVNLANLLFHYGEYAGIGIKTAMGMGELSIVPRDNSSKERPGTRVKEGENDR